MEYRYVLDDEHIEKQFLINIGKRMRDIRQSKKIRQNEIAYRCNFDKSSFNNIEAGKRNITILTLRKIAVALEVNIEELLIFNPTQKSFLKTHHE